MKKTIKPTPEHRPNGIKNGGRKRQSGDAPIIRFAWNTISEKKA